MAFNEKIFRSRNPYLRDIHNKLVTIALAKSAGNRKKAAKQLGISVRTLHRFIHERITEDE